jgi:PTS system nitrogen regulatory IIA component
MASTGIGRHVALPHPRSRIDFGLKNAHIPVFFLKNPIDFNAHDGQPVSCLFMLITTTTREHLKMLGRISRLLHEDDFLKALQQRSTNLAAIIKTMCDDEK